MAARPSSRRPTNPLPPQYQPLSIDHEPSQRPAIPQGPCNWRNLHQAGHASTCGCRRFWAQDNHVEQEQHHNLDSALSNGERAYCYCGHHACFHQEHAEGSQATRTRANTRSAGEAGLHTALPTTTSRNKSHSFHSQSSTSRRYRQRVGTVVHALKADNGSDPYNAERAATVHPSAGFANSPSRSRDLGAAPSGLGLYVEQTRHQPFAEKLSAAAQFAADQLPPTQSQSHRTTEVSSQRSGPLRNSPERIFSEHIQGLKSQAINLPTLETLMDVAVRPNDLEHSATEIATPSNGGTPALNCADEVLQKVNSNVDALYKDATRVSQRASGTQSVSQRAQQSFANPVTYGDGCFRSSSFPQPLNRVCQPADIASLVSQVASLRHLVAQIPNQGMSITSLGQRMDALESASFAHSSIEEVSDRFEHFDGRVLDLENRVDELEKVQSDSIIGSSPLNSETSNGPGSHRARASIIGLHRATNNAIEYPAKAKYTAIERLLSIEQRLTDLGTSQPTRFQPTTIEVVFLPWGRDLKGIWHDPKEASPASAHVLSASEDEGRDRTSAADALVPRALGPSPGVSGRVYDRLKSRGFVRTIELVEPSAKSIHAKVVAAFDEILDRRSPQTRDANISLPPLLGLRSRFIPLQKIHKQSQLHFLAESELSTPALWTWQFLDSIFMKAPNAGLTRLYITTPAAYMQAGGDAGWTWQKLRELPRVDVEGVRDGSKDAPHVAEEGVDEADAREPCWEYDARLENPQSQNSSFDSRPPGESVSFESSHHPSPPCTKPDIPTDGEEKGSGDEGDEYEPPSSGENSEQGYPTHAPITPVSDLHTSLRPSSTQIRSASFPMHEAMYCSSVPHITVFEQPHPKRQVASFDNAFDADTFREIGLPSSRPLSSLSKRRRLSRTPSGRELNVENGPFWTPRRSLGAGSPMQDEASVEAPELRAASKDTSKDRGQGAYATPYSWTAQARVDGDNDTEMDASPDEEDDEYEESQEMIDDSSDDERDPTFAYSIHPSVDSELEMDEAVMLDEEAWEGVADEDEEFPDDQVPTTRNTRRRVGHSRRRSGPRRRVVNHDAHAELDDSENDGPTHRENNDNGGTHEFVEGAFDDSDSDEDE